MLHHEPSHEPSPHRHAAPPNDADHELPRDPRLEARVEDFLDRAFARLIPVMGYEERCERRAALRERIDEAIAAHEELGSTREEALALALAQVQGELPVAGQAVLPV